MSSLLPQGAIVAIFSNIEAILPVNKELFSCMRQYSLGEAFTYLGPFLKLYSTYANNFQNANSVLHVSLAAPAQEMWPLASFYFFHPGLAEKQSRFQEICRITRSKTRMLQPTASSSSDNASPADPKVLCAQLASQFFSVQYS